MKGVLNLVSVGPGFADFIVPRAEAALRDSGVIVAYELYLRWIEPWLADKEIHTPPLTQERERALLAIEKARSGAKVALISSGYIGIYAMAALAFDEMREDDEYDVNVIPGITSANACAFFWACPCCTTLPRSVCPICYARGTGLSSAADILPKPIWPVCCITCRVRAARKACTASSISCWNQNRRRRCAAWCAMPIAPVRKSVFIRWKNHPAV